MNKGYLDNKTSVRKEALDYLQMYETEERTLEYLIGYFKYQDTRGNSTIIDNDEIKAIEFILENNDKLREIIDNAKEYLINTYKSKDDKLVRLIDTTAGKELLNILEGKDE